MMTFHVNDEDAKKIAEFVREQNKLWQASKQGKDPLGTNMAYYGAIGGGYTYSFTPTSIGVVFKVTHTVTGAELDLSDYEHW